MPFENYIVNRNPQPTGEHEIHVINGTCFHLPNSENRISLGQHAHCSGAVAEARNRFPGSVIDGCFYCCPDCHTR